MSIEYQIQDKNPVLKVKSAGTCDNLGQLKEYVLAMHRATLSAGVTKVLVDERELCYHLSTIDSYESGKFVAEMARFGIKIGVVCNSEGKADAKFWETVAVNRGAAVRVFDDVIAAEAWLRQPAAGVSRRYGVHEYPDCPSGIGALGHIFHSRGIGTGMID
jgi:hypothetical protein